MSENLCYTDAYARQVDAVVVEVDADAHAALLDRTVFYPGGGGQPHDTGTLSADGRGWTVVKVEKRGADVLHHLEGADPPSVGTPIRGAIDWERRYRLMRTHTALHVLCGVVWREFGAQVTGGQMYLDRARMDFELEDLSPERVRAIEERANAAIAAGAPVSVRLLPREEAFQIPDLIRTKINLLPPSLQEIRTVEIVGLDLQADGGTHVANTREVGRLRIAGYKSKGRINKRIEVAVEE